MQVNTTIKQANYSLYINFINNLNYKSMKTVFTKHNLECANFTIKPNEEKTELAGVNFTDNETVGTDIYNLLIVSKPKSEIYDISNYPVLPGTEQSELNIDTNFIIPAKNLKDLKLKPNSVLPIIDNTFIVSKNNNNKSIEFATTDLESADKKVIKTIDGEYQKYRMIVPDNTNNMVKIKIKPEDLEKMAKAFKNITKGNKSQYVELYIDKDNEEKPLYFKAVNNKTEQTAEGLIAPAVIKD